ncbi:DUF3304 domain-containing protein [Paraherbaspirillum soli]|uniref:DUF3304 domain-containing protein n=1 Tax=Paraherbaspirillum soli TaxID=631222 RepID=A0ABW0M5T1_9BURK
MCKAIKRIGIGLRTVLILLALGLLPAIAGCEEEKIPVSVTGYNHMPYWSIRGFSVNGGSGPNVTPEAGGGKFSCCVEIPKHWRPGMKAKVSWAYDTDQGGPRPPPPQEAEVEIPEYTPENLGSVQVHFYPDHRIKVVVSRYGITSPCGPLSDDDKLPWKTRQDLIEYYLEGKGRHERCDRLHPQP